MLNLPFEWKHIAGPLGAITLAIITFILEPLSTKWLTYDRILISALELWRLITGNLLHTNLNHLLLNAAGILLLWALHGEHYDTVHYLKVLVVCCVGCTTGLYFFSPDLAWYVGLSGPLHGMFVYGAVLDIKKKIMSGWLLLVGVTVKLYLEQTGGASEQIESLIDATVATDAHLYGAITGGLVAMLVMGENWFKTDSRPSKEI